MRVSCVRRGPGIDGAGKAREPAGVRLHCARGLTAQIGARNARDDRQVRNLLHRLDVAAHVDDRLASRLVDVAAGHALILFGNGVDDVVEGKVARGELGGIHLDFIRRRRRAADVRIRDARNLLDLRNDLVGRVERRSRRARAYCEKMRQRDDRLFGRIADVHRRRLHVRRQLPLRRLNGFFRQREIGRLIRRDRVGGGDLCLTLLHDRRNVLQVGRPGEVLFDRRDDVVAHLRDGRAAVARRDRNRRLRDVWEELLDDRQQRDDAGEHHDGDENEDQRRALEEEPGQVHCSVTLSPLPTLAMPLLTTRVPGGRPATTAVTPSSPISETCVTCTTSCAFTVMICV